MTPRDRVLAALQGQPPEQIPWIEHALDRRVVLQAFDLGPFPQLPPAGIERDLFVLELDKRINRAIGICNLEVPSRYTMAPRIRNPGEASTPDAHRQCRPGAASSRHAGAGSPVRA